MPHLDAVEVAPLLHLGRSLLISAYRLPIAGASTTSCVLILHLYMVQTETRCYHQCEETISIIKSWCQEGHSVNINKPNSRITRCHLDDWEPSNTASKCGKECVFLYGFHAHDIKHKL